MPFQTLINTFNHLQSEIKDNMPLAKTIDIQQVEEGELDI